MSDTSQTTVDNAPTADLNPPSMAPRSYGIGSVLSLSFSILKQNFIPFMVMALILLLPTSLYSVLQSTGNITFLSPNAIIFANIALPFIELALSMVLYATLTYGTYQALSGRRASIGENLSRGLPFILPGLGVTFIAVFAAIVGFILLIIPGIMVFIMLYVALPALVVERQGVFASLKRSRVLTKGRRWFVFGTVLITFLVSFGIILGIGTVWGVSLLQMVEPAAINNSTLILSGVILLVQAATSAFGAVLCTVVYNELRIEKEGGSAAQIASVFD